MKLGSTHRSLVKQCINGVCKGVHNIASIVSPNTVSSSNYFNQYKKSQSAHIIMLCYTVSSVIFPAFSGDLILTVNGILRMGPSAEVIYIATLLAYGPTTQDIY